MIRLIIGILASCVLATQAAAVEYETLLPEEAAIDVAGELRGRTVGEYKLIREQIVDHVFNGEGLPTATAVVEATGTPESWVQGAADQQQIRMDMDGGVYSRAYRLRASEPEECLFVYHFGHGEGYRYQWDNPNDVYVLGQPESGVRTLTNAMLARGCDVILMSMPFAGDNHNNIVSGINESPHTGTYAHQALGTTETVSYSPLAYFAEPIVRAINFGLSDRSYELIGMAGKSGGSWSTTLAAAIDPRITSSYSVSGTMPMYLRELRSGDMGDWEQSGARLWDRFDYLDLYMLGALEDGRDADVIWRKFDACCFQGNRVYAFMPQLIGTAARMGVTGLSFFVEDGTQVVHAVTAEIANRITNDFYALASAIPDPSAVTGGRAPDVILEDIRPNGTNGGSNVVGTNIRTLTATRNVDGLATVNGNQWSLPEGFYYIEGSAAAFEVNRVRCYIHNVTDNTDPIVGMSNFAPNGLGGSPNNQCAGVVTLASPKAFQLRQYMQTVRSNAGLGLAASSGHPEVFAKVKIWKVD